MKTAANLSAKSTMIDNDMPPGPLALITSLPLNAHQSVEMTACWHRCHV
jgi:hypothetical protein